MISYWIVFTLAMAWLSLVSDHVPEPYLVSVMKCFEDSKLIVNRMRYFTYRKHNYTVKVNLTIGTQNSPPRLDCKNALEINFEVRDLTNTDIYSRHCSQSYE